MGHGVRAEAYGWEADVALLGAVGHHEALGRGSYTAHPGRRVFREVEQPGGGRASSLLRAVSLIGARGSMMKGMSDPRYSE